ncbi:putative uncharacterized protein C8orf89 homolog isoform X1 [Ascaphus truei]|uniref:putative uncharacterized protein C8orf89 homolog isoform X1 n=1 Tax=Ascaphus truei TaxID=8439 RepID=UPI003F5AC9F3
MLILYSYLTYMCLLSDLPVKVEHAISRILPRHKYPNTKLSDCNSKPSSIEEDWSNAFSETKGAEKAIYSSSLCQNTCIQNTNMPRVQERISGFKVTQLPPLDVHGGLIQCASQPHRDRSKISKETCNLLSQQKQKNSSGYLNPLSGARMVYLQRIAEIATLESETIRQENMKKLKAKRDVQ